MRDDAYIYHGKITGAAQKKRSIDSDLPHWALLLTMSQIPVGAHPDDQTM